MPTTQPDILTLIARLRAQDQEFCVATVVRTQDTTAARAGAKAVVLDDGTIHGFLGGGCVLGAVRKAARVALATGEPALIRVKPREAVAGETDSDGVPLHKSACPSGGTTDLFIEPLRQPPILLVCGGSPVAVAVADLGRRLGYRTLVAAPDADLARFDDGHRRVPAFQFQDLRLAEAYVVVATQGVRDSDALRAALAAQPRYVGFVGSRRKAAVLRQRLVEAGTAPEALARLVAPAGLDIQAIEPEEIALSILAEVVATRRAHARQSLAGDDRQSA